MDRIVDAAESEQALEQRELALVTVDLPRANLGGLAFKRGDGSDVVVATVDGAAAVSLVIGKKSIRAAASLVIGKGFILRSVDTISVGLQSTATAVDGDPVVGEDLVDAEDQADAQIISVVKAAFDATDADTVKCVFERPPPPIPPHGWARKSLRREPNTAFTKEQKAFLDKHFESSLTGGERMRDKKVLLIMQNEFGRRHGENGRSLVLKQSQIRGYFSRRAASMKRGAVDAALQVVDGDGDDKIIAGSDDDEYNDFKVPELKDMLRSHSLKVSGKKEVLMSRLRAFDEGRGSDEEAEPAPQPTRPRRR